MESSESDIELSEQLVAMCTWIIYSVVCQVINIFGIITNTINIICFSKQGFRDSMNVTLLVLTVSDLCSLLTMVWTCICFTPVMNEADLSFDTFDVMYITTGMTHLSFTRVSSCITAMITLERCLCITIPLKIKRIVTPRRTATISILIFIIFFSIGSPVYAVNKLDTKFYPLRNKSLVGLVSTEDRDDVESISFAINNFAIPFSAFLIIVICTFILSFELKRQTQWRAKTNTTAQINRLSSRNQKAAKMVVMISTLFIVCFIPVTISALVAAFQSDRSVNGTYWNIALLFEGFGYTMESINASMNICIYYYMSSNYKDIFCKLFSKCEAYRRQVI